MDVFISWSGTRSLQFARAIKEWLKDVLHGVTPWMSEHDIAAGSRWHLKLIEAIERSTFGVLCVTSESQSSPWMIFEAGALSRQVKLSSVVPILLDLPASELKSPLSQFQSVEATRDGIFQLTQTLNSCLPNPLEGDRLRRSFERCWPELEREIKSSLAIGPNETLPVVQTDRQLMEETLALVRGVFQAQIPVFTAGEGDQSVFVDVRPVCENDGTVVRVMIDDTTEVHHFLDQVYYAINRYGKIQPYKYGILWLLKDARTGHIFDQMGLEYCRSEGKVLDERRLNEVGIFPDARLIAYRIENA